MSAKPIPPGDYSPLLPEVRHLFGSFAELRARIRARRAVGVSTLMADGGVPPATPDSVPKPRDGIGG